MATAGRAPATTAISPGQGPAATGAAVAAVARRMRVQHALDALPAALLVGAIVAAVGICALKLGHGALATALLWLACAPLPLALALTALRPVPRLRAARLIDGALGEKDLIASAWAFEALPEAERTPFMRACIESAARRAGDASAAEALPFRRPRGLGEAGLGVLGAGLLLLLEVPVRVAVPPPEPPRVRLMQQEDLAAFADEVEPVASAEELDPELRAVAQELNTLLEAIGDGELERAEALRELRKLEAKLAEQLNEAEQDALKEALAELGRAMGKSGEAEALAEALKQGQAERARAAMADLAKRLESKPLADRERRDLQKRLKKAALKPQESSAAEERKKRELERLLKKQREQQKELSKRDKRLLKKKKRELERLQRERQARAQARRRLDQLRRRLDGASGQLGQGKQRDAARELSQAEQELSRMGRSQLSEEQRERLKQQLEQLRQLMSKQRGQKGQKQQQSGAGEDGKGKQGRQLGLEGFARAARGQKDGKTGKGKDGKGGKAMQLGPGDGQPAGLLELQGTASGTPQHDPDAVGGHEGGEGGRSRSGKETRLDVKHEQTQVAGEHGRGPTRSEVIHEAGSRGFATQAYEKVHAEYERHAESVLERDEVPGGYRFYVRRYFQLIRPREGGE